jgi:hypothetical protein
MRFPFIRVRTGGRYTSSSTTPPAPPPAPTNYNLNFGRLTKQGMGGYPTTETPHSALTGADALKFAIDADGYLVPAAAGVISYGSAWTAPVGASTVLTGASGTTYTVTLLANKAHARDHAADDTQIQAYLAVNAGLTDGGWVLLRDGHINPSGGRNDLQLWPGYATFNLTLASETVDTGVDAYGNPRLHHGCKIGNLNMQAAAGDLTQSMLLVIRDIWGYCDNPAFGQHAIFSQVFIGAISGLRITNCLAEFGPSVDPAWIGGAGIGVPIYGINVSWSTVDHCRVNNCGYGIGTVGSKTHAASCTNNIIHDIIVDFMNFGGINFTITDNWCFHARGNSVRDGLHGDCGQLQSTTDGDATVVVAGTIKDNFAAFDLGVTKTQGWVFFGDNAISGSYSGFVIQGNASVMCASTGAQLTQLDNVTYKWNLNILSRVHAVDPTTDYVSCIVNPVYAGGGNLFGNVSNSFALANQTGGAVTSPNITLATTDAATDAALPNLRAYLNGSDRTLAGFKAALVPANRLVTATPPGLKNVDGTWNGPFKGDGSKNDGLT